MSVETLKFIARCRWHYALNEPHGHGHTVPEGLVLKVKKKKSKLTGNREFAFDSCGPEKERNKIDGQ